MQRDTATLAYLVVLFGLTAIVGACRGMCDILVALAVWPGVFRDDLGWYTYLNMLGVLGG